jgi:hypothetical protein
MISKDILETSFIKTTSMKENLFAKKNIQKKINQLLTDRPLSTAKTHHINLPQRMYMIRW